jgi:hypothetical protein
LEARWPGSVGVELAGMVGSVETPTVYEPETTQVVRVPGSLHNVAGNPDGCRSVYPEPAGGTPVTDAREFIPAYGRSVADAVAATLQGARTYGVRTISSQQQPLCVQLENNLFKAAFAAGLFPDRPAYADQECTVPTKPQAPGSGASAGASAAAPAAENPTYLKTNVGVLTLGQVQLAYSPGEVFPLTEVRGAIDEAQMPFPTDCYEPSSENYYCGNPLPMTPWISAEMTRRFRFLVGLGEDMIGYMFPPGNFVGSEGEVSSEPWFGYQAANQTGHDRFGYGHSDDSESVGPYAGLDVTNALQGLLASDGVASRVMPGLYIDAASHLSDSPFASGAFTGAVGVKVLPPGKTTPRTYLIGSSARGWSTFDAQPDPGTAGTALAYSVRTGGVFPATGKAILVDVFEGERKLGP